MKAGESVRSKKLTKCYELFGVTVFPMFAKCSQNVIGILFVKNLYRFTEKRVRGIDWPFTGAVFRPSVSLRPLELEVGAIVLAKRNTRLVEFVKPWAAN